MTKRRACWILARGLAWAPPGAAKAAETVMIPFTVEFSDVEGEARALTAGLYHASESGEDAIELRLIVDGEPVRVRAAMGTHDQDVDETVFLAVRNESGGVHVLVLKPDGSQLEAVGVAAGIATRGQPMIRKARLATAVQRTTTRRQRFSKTQVAEASISPLNALQAQLSKTPAATQVKEGAPPRPIPESEPEPAPAPAPEPQPEYVFAVPLDVRSLHPEVEGIV